MLSKTILFIASSVSASVYLPRCTEQAKNLNAAYWLGCASAYRSAHHLGSVTCYMPKPPPVPSTQLDALDVAAPIPDNLGGGQEFYQVAQAVFAPR